MISFRKSFLNNVGNLVGMKVGSWNLCACWSLLRLMWGAIRVRLWSVLRSLFRLFCLLCSMSSGYRRINC
jgi:hypothetical protein